VIWQILDTGPAEASHNMAIDAMLLEQLSDVPHPILHLYEWQDDSTTYGHFLNPFDYLNEEGVRKRGLHLAKRPTGGGIIFHLWDFAYSILIPASQPDFSINTLENYAFVNRIAMQAIKEFSGNGLTLTMLPAEEPPFHRCCTNFCMAKPTKYDIVNNGRKVGGSAQRRTKHGLLHQGTISLSIPDEDYLNDVLVPREEVIQAMKQNSSSLLGMSCSQIQLNESRKCLKHILMRHVKKEEA
jgi:lipoate---protein ligase